MIGLLTLSTKTGSAIDIGQLMKDEKIVCFLLTFEILTQYTLGCQSMKTFVLEESK